MTQELALPFHLANGLDASDRTRLMGGKGAALARMVSLGLPVPPGFTLTTDACRRFLRNGWSADLNAAVDTGLADLEAQSGRVLGDAANPLLVSVRSGAPVSMPGMMDTVLNAGMTIDVAVGLGDATGDARLGWDTYRRFLQSYVGVVLDAPDEVVRRAVTECLGNDEGRSLSANGLAEAAVSLKGVLAELGYEIPDVVQDQVRHAIRAVFQSWSGDRASVYRRVEGIGDDLGTGATVQMMVFGNLGDRSGTGVAFSRDPSTGEPGVMGDFLVQAQGEDVVAGTHKTLPVTALKQRWPDIANELDRTAALLERDLGGLADIEFTVEDGTFWLLQVRKGKHSQRAALRMAIDMADDPDFPLSRDEALERVADVLADPPTLSSGVSESAQGEVLAVGLGASPGRAIGFVCTDVDAAVAAQEEGRSVILIRRETSPADIAGMAAAAGIMTTLGGLVSHAAVVARGWGLPAVVGADGIEVLDDGIRIGTRVIPAGTEVTVDGTTGELLLGAHHAVETEVPEVAVLRAWKRDIAPTVDVARGGVAEEATAATVGRALTIKGMSDAGAIALVLGTTEDVVRPLIDALVERGDAQELPKGRVRATPALIAKMGEWFAGEATRLGPHIEAQMESFHAVNTDFKIVVTDWQMRCVDGNMVPNDHTDTEYDASVVARLRCDIHAAIGPILGALARAEPRLGRYLERLELALAAVEDGIGEMVAHPLKDSYHTVWFELHEELIRLSGRNRAEEAAAGRA